MPLELCAWDPADQMSTLDVLEQEVQVTVSCTDVATGHEIPAGTAGALTTEPPRQYNQQHFCSQGT